MLGFNPLATRPLASGVSTIYTLSCSNGTYAYTGQAAVLVPLHKYTLSASNGTYTYTGQSATLTRAFQFQVNNGVYTVTGQNATLAPLHHYSLTCTKGTYNVVGQSSTLAYLDRGWYVINNSQTPNWQDINTR